MPKTVADVTVAYNGSPSAPGHNPDKADVEALHVDHIERIQTLETEVVQLAGGIATSVVAFMEGNTDQDAFQAAIDSLPDVDDFHPTQEVISGSEGILTNGEWPVYEIIVPKKPAGLSLDTEAWYSLTDHLKLGNRDIIWRVESSARIGASNGAMQLLGGKVLFGANIFMTGYRNYDHSVNLTLGQGTGQLSANSTRFGVSNYTPDTVSTQAYEHERGGSTAVFNVSDQQEIKIPGTGVTYTANGVAFATPLTEALSDLIRPGHIVDTVGNMLTGPDIRHTSRIIATTRDAQDRITSLSLEPWRRMDPTTVPLYSASLESTPTGGTALVINPRNKIWNLNANIFLSKTDGALFGYTSGSVVEAGVSNNTGDRAGIVFARDDHPFHIWGFDMPHIGNNGGGIAYVARTKGVVKEGASTDPAAEELRWVIGYESKAADIGFHSAGTKANGGQIAFAADAGGEDVGFGTGTHRLDYVARQRIDGEWDEHYRVIGGSPIIELGRRGSASTPTLRFFADGNADDDSDLWDARIQVSNDNGGTLRADAIADILFATSGTVRARVLNTGLQVTGLLSGTAVVQNATDTTAGRVLTTGSGVAQAYRAGNVVGTVSQSGGTPTGAVIESGSNANGYYVRFADGTQICWKEAVLSASISGTAPGNYVETSWTYPAAFATSDVRVVPNTRSFNGEEFREDAATHLRSVGGNDSTTNGVIGCKNLHTSAVDARIDGIAYGRWF